MPSAISTPTTTTKLKPVRGSEYLITMLLFHLGVYLVSIPESYMSRSSCYILMGVSFVYICITGIALMVQRDCDPIRINAMVFFCVIGIPLFIVVGLTVFASPGSVTSYWAVQMSLLLCFVLAALFLLDILMVLPLARRNKHILARLEGIEKPVVPFDDKNLRVSEPTKNDLATSVSSMRLPPDADENTTPDHSYRKVSFGRRREYVDSPTSVPSIAATKIAEIQTEPKNVTIEGSQTNKCELKEVLVQTVSRCEFCNQQMIATTTQSSQQVCGSPCPMIIQLLRGTIALPFSTSGTAGIVQIEQDHRQQTSEAVQFTREEASETEGEIQYTTEELTQHPEEQLETDQDEAKVEEQVAEVTPQESLPTESVPRESLTKETLPRESLPRDSLTKETGPRESLPRDSLTKETQHRESLTKETQPRVSLTKETQPRVSLTKETQQRDSLTKETQPRVSLTKETQPRDSLTKETGPRESLPRDSLTKETQPRVSLTKETQPRDSLTKETLPRESLPRDSLTKETGPRESLPRDSLTKETQHRDSLTKEIQHRESLTKETQPRVSLTKETQQRDSLTKETQPRVSLTKETQPRVSLTKETQPRVSLTKETQPRVSLTKETQPRESLTKETQHRESLTKETQARESLPKETLPREPLITEVVRKESREFRGSRELRRSRDSRGSRGSRESRIQIREIEKGNGVQVQVPQMQLPQIQQFSQMQQLQQMQMAQPLQTQQPQQPLTSITKVTVTAFCQSPNAATMEVATSTGSKENISTYTPVPLSVTEGGEKPQKHVRMLQVDRPEKGVCPAVYSKYESIITGQCRDSEPRDESVITTSSFETEKEEPRVCVTKESRKCVKKESRKSIEEVEHKKKSPPKSETDVKNAKNVKKSSIEKSESKVLRPTRKDPPTTKTRRTKDPKTKKSKKPKKDDRTYSRFFPLEDVRLREPRTIDPEYDLQNVCIPMQRHEMMDYGTCSNRTPSFFQRTNRIDPVYMPECGHYGAQTDPYQCELDTAAVGKMCYCLEIQWMSKVFVHL